MINSITNSFSANAATMLRSRAADTPASVTRSATPPASIASDFKAKFAELANDPAKFNNLLATSFGNSYDAATAESLRKAALNGDFSWLPEVRYLDNSAMNGAAGAYDQASHTIYINSAIKGDPALEQQVFNEEAGHHLDATLNHGIDSPGDEGEIFRRLLSGENLSVSQLTELRSTNDHNTAIVDGKSVAVENFSLGKIFKSIGNAISSVVKPITSAIGSIVSPITSVLGSMVSPITSLLGNVLKPITNVIGDGLDKVKDFLKPVLNFLKPVLSIGLPIASFFFPPLAAASGVFSSILGGASGLFGSVIGGAGGVLGNLAAGATGIFGNLAGSASGLLGSLAGKATGFLGNIFGESGIISNMMGGATSLAGKLFGSASGVFNNLVGTAANQFGGLIDGAQNVLGNAFQNGATGLFNSAIQKAGAGGNSILQYLSSLITKGADAANPLADLAKYGVNYLKNKAGSLFSNFAIKHWSSTIESVQQYIKHVLGMNVDLVGKGRKAVTSFVGSLLSKVGGYFGIGQTA
ncbi:MAG: hypothetical protein HY286_10185 [Planctomycetes bacterium]|nr:hypothetical protein [Planctomycetota bacterium]